MKTTIKSILLVAALFPVSYLKAATVIHAGNAFTGTDDKLTGPVSLIIENDIISEIRNGHIKVAKDDTLIDLSESVVLPGLMDMHVHLSSQQSGTSSYLKRFTLNEADYALAAAHYANKTLMAGFTTVRNLGDSYNETVSLRNAINQGMATGPRIYTAAKSLATTGGHADPSNGMAKRIRPDTGPAAGVINGVAEARQAVRQRYQDGADAIKITATGGVLSVAKSGQNPQFMNDELDAVVATAKDYGMTVAVHAHGKEGMIRAIKAGVTSIEHGTYMDEEVMALMKEYGTYYVPTILAGEFVAEKAKIDGYFPDIVRPKAAAIGPLIQATFGKAYKNGVNIAFGTDSGVSAHGDNGQEFGLMVEAGMPPAKAIQAATINAATMLGIEDKLGTLEAGKFADIVAVKGNPLQDITTLENVQFVMKGGKIYKQQGRFPLVKEKLKRKTKALVDSQHMLRGITIASFLESTIVPIPLEAVLIPLMQAKREKLWLIALMATVGCIIGALFGYAIGYFLFDAVGQDLISWFGSEQQFERVTQKMEAQGFWFVLTLGIVPVPFQIAMLAAGATKYSIWLFLLATVIARSLRYFGLALIVKVFGNKAERFIRRYKTKAMIGITVVAAGLWLILSQKPA